MSDSNLVNEKFRKMSNDLHPQEAYLEAVIQQILEQKHGADLSSLLCKPKELSKFDKDICRFYTPLPTHNVKFESYKDEF